jgi:flagellar protein FlaI
MVSILKPARKKAKPKLDQELVKGLLPTVEPTIKSGYLNELIPETAEVVEKYWIKEPFAGVVIAKLPEAGGSLEYFVQEITLNDVEQSVLDKIIEVVSVEINPSALEKQEDVKIALLEEAKRIMAKYVRKFPTLLDEHVKEKINYYLERDLLGYGPIHTLMNDWRIEDISCDGVNSNIYIWHRRYESVPTSIKFTDRKALDDFIVKLAHKSGKHVSSAFPIVDAMIFGKHRLAASFREEISPKGSTFTIRKFREEPYSIVDLMNLNTVSDSIAAYLWLMMENRASILVIGGTAAGKTTILNAIAGLIKPGYKVVTVEETAEINIPTENWVQFTSRESYGLSGNKVGEVSLFDLVRTSLRYRPDFLIVGEVRGEEAFVLFQAVATGHGGLCTIHGESLDTAVKRLTSPPMNVAESYIPLMNVAMMLERVVLPKTVAGVPFGRRTTNVWEIEDFSKYVSVFEWSPTEDIFYDYTRRSVMLHRFAYRTGRSFTDMLEEIERRRALLKYLQVNNIRQVKEVYKYITEYYVDREAQFRRLGIKVEVTAPQGQPEEPVAPIQSSVQQVAEMPNFAALPTEPIKLLQSGSFQILGALFQSKGPLEEETLMKDVGLGKVEFDSLLSMLVKVGHAKVEKVGEGADQKSYVAITADGTRAYSLISKNLADAQGKARAQKAPKPKAV